MNMIVSTAIAGAVVASKPAAALPIATQCEEAAKPKPNDDEKLLNLAEQYLAAWAEFDRRCSIKSRMEEKQFAVKKSEKMKARAEDSELGIPIFFGEPVSDGESSRPPKPRERADEIVAAYDAWKNARKPPRGMLTAEREEICSP